MKNPAHPGRIVRHDCLEPLGLSVTAGAKVLGVTRQALNNIVNGKSGISPEMAIRLTNAFGSTEETWLRMQIAYDLAVNRKNESKIKVRRQIIPQELHVHRRRMRRDIIAVAAYEHHQERLDRRSGRARRETGTQRGRSCLARPF